VITTVREERLLIVSDVHLGNSIFRARRLFLEFLGYARDRDFSVCINGDGVDIMQMSLARLTKDLGACAAQFAALARKGLRVHYVVGNHDVVLEHFLADWGTLHVVPFLNVLSGDQRIRVEHGHLYDVLFERYPRAYAAVTVLGGMALRIHPRLFHALSWTNEALIAIGDLQQRVLQERSGQEPRPSPVPGERASYIDAAAEIAERGFDAVVFGHTHRVGTADLGQGRRYYNTGCWLADPYVLEIDHGAMRFMPLFGRDAPLAGSWSRQRGSWARSTQA
jgi:UDP-2,3-diacylglucosamine pyrophosphatase LpxH